MIPLLDACLLTDEHSCHPHAGCCEAHHRNGDLKYKEESPLPAVRQAECAQARPVSCDAGLHINTRVGQMLDYGWSCQVSTIPNINSAAALMLSKHVDKRHAGEMQPTRSDINILTRCNLNVSIHQACCRTWRRLWRCMKSCLLGVAEIWLST